MRERGEGAFTLMEMLVVIAIMGTLAGLLLTAVNSAREAARKAKARDSAHQLANAWEALLLDRRDFPDTSITEMDPDTVKILGTTTTAYNRSRIYMEFATNELANGFLDPWGERMSNNGESGWENRRYRAAVDNGQGNDAGQAYDGQVTLPSGEIVNRSAVAWSCGKDGVDNTADDVQSWK